MKITPQWISTFETNEQTLIVDAWKRALKYLVWDKFMDVRQSGTLRELYFWLIETAQIYDEAQGGQKRYDDLAATFYEIDNANSGAGLLLTKNEIEDNMMAAKAMRGMPALDYAANWAKQMGGAAAYRPQEKFFSLLGSAKTQNSYDGVAFFANNHPVHPLGGGGTYSNLLTAKPLTVGAGGDLSTAAANLTAAIANMRGFKQPNGKYRFVRPKYLLHGPDLAWVVPELLKSRFFNATENVAFNNMGIEGICCDELSGEPGVWYLGAELMPGEGGPFIWQDRAPYTMTSYTSDSMVELQRRKQFEWDFDGRNASSFGHPYLFQRNEPT